MKEGSAILVPTIVKFAFVFVGPLLRHLMRPVRGTAGPIHEERFVGREGLVLPQPEDGVVREVFTEMVVVVAAGSVRSLNKGVVPHEARFILRSLPGEEAIEILKTVTAGPIIEGAGGGRIRGGRVVPLSPSPGVITVAVFSSSGSSSISWQVPSSRMDLTASSCCSGFRSDFLRASSNSGLVYTRSISPSPSLCSLP